MTVATAARAWLALSFVVGAAYTHADIVTTADGARLVGKVEKMTPKSIDLVTTYAGKITLDMAHVQTVETTAPVTTRFADETTVTGVTRIDESGTLTVDGLARSARIDSLLASWQPDATPPPESGYDPRNWVYTIGADVVGKSGNSDEISTNFVGDALLATRSDELHLYAKYARAEQESLETSDEAIGGASYAAYMYDPWGWYVRGEVERDPFEDIDLRTTLAAGLSYRPINTDERTLKFFTGLGYRHESFADGTDDSAPTLDTGLNHRWVAKPWLTMTNALTWAPAIDDFDNYLLVHDSGLEMPVGLSRWTLRLGVRNDYKSEPAPDKDELDTTYYSRLFLRID